MKTLTNESEEILSSYEDTQMDGDYSSDMSSSAESYDQKAQYLKHINLML